LPEMAVAGVLLLVLPGVAVTATSFPSYDAMLYDSFGNVTASDFAMLDWAGAHLPDGARVLVAPGSAAGFLPGYAPGAVVLFPMIGGARSNGSYELVVGELDNGTLDAAGERAMANLSVGFVAVTGANSQLYEPFEPFPLLDDARYSVIFQEGDAYLFSRAP
ncbi:MAG TPA: hypothetical protein VMH90_01865, partial [Thermoplasmata archaeon]|nr:hypothetical protein [Thermoplasmata archaeon]